MRIPYLFNKGTLAGKSEKISSDPKHRGAGIERLAEIIRSAILALTKGTILSLWVPLSTAYSGNVSSKAKWLAFLIL